MVKHVYYTTLGVAHREGGAGTLSNTYYSMDITEIQKHQVFLSLLQWEYNGNTIEMFILTNNFIVYY